MQIFVVALLIFRHLGAAQISIDSAFAHMARLSAKLGVDEANVVLMTQTSWKTAGQVIGYERVALSEQSELITYVTIDDIKKAIVFDADDIFALIDIGVYTNG